MNKKFVSLFVVLFFQLVQAQTNQTSDSLLGVYPLQVGNVWQYWSYDYLNGQTTWFYGWTETVIGDTVMSNAKKYSIISSDKKLTKNIFWRQELNKVYQFESGKDSLIYDFAKRKGDILLILPVTMDDTLFQWIKDDGFANYFGQSRHIWIYNMFFSKITYYEERDIVDGIGMSYFLREGGDEWFLRGAIINGIKYGTVTSVNDDHSGLKPTNCILLQNYPNPFNPTTTISYDLPFASDVSLIVYDCLGREIITAVRNYQTEGNHKTIFDGSNLSTGVYFYKIKAGTFTSIKKMLLLK